MKGNLHNNVSLAHFPDDLVLRADSDAVVDLDFVVLPTWVGHGDPLLSRPLVTRNHKLDRILGGRDIEI